MSRLPFFLILLLVFFMGNSSLIASEKKPSITEIIKLAKEANALMQNGFYEESLVKSRLALHHAIATKDNSTIAYCYNTIGANFDELEEADKAFYYYTQALKYAKKTSNNLIKNWLYNNIGNIYCFDKKQYEKGIYYYKKSLEYSSKTKNAPSNAFTKLNITWAYFDIGKFKEGFPYFEFINKYYLENPDKSTEVALNMLNAMYYSYKNKNQEAIFFFENAIKLGTLGDEKSDLSFSYLEYSKFLFKIGNHKEAYENLKLFNSISEKLYTEEKTKKANVAGINIELDETKREILKVENGYKQKQELLKEKQSRTQKIFLIVVGLFTLVGILLYFFFQNFKLKQKNKFNIIQSKLQQKIINASIDGQELERKKIATFLHDNISAKLSSAGLHLFAFTAIEKINSEEIDKTKTILKEVHDEIRNLSHELLPTLLAKFGLFYAIHDLCEKNSNTMLKLEYISSIPLKKRYNEEYETKIYFIIMELFNNILKYSQASEAKINLKEENKELIINIEDNGKGFVTSKSKINEGFGLTQLRARVSSMNGIFKINSIPNIGTFVTLKLPIQEKN